MLLKPQDVVVLLKFVALGQRDWTYAWLGVQLGMSPSQLHAAVKRALAAQLAVRSGEHIVAHRRNLEEFLVHGIKYVFVPERGELTRGMPTGYAAPPLVNYFASAEEPPPVWPTPNGSVRGQAFSPLYSLVPGAAARDDRLYELLALVDALRGGRARERDLAIKELRKRLEHDGQSAKSEHPDTGVGR
jgi:hypothetical protein